MHVINYYIVLIIHDDILLLNYVFICEEDKKSLQSKGKIVYKNINVEFY